MHLNSSLLRVSLHLGPAKTGSTTLQLGLSHERETLLRAGFYYPVGVYEPSAQHELPNWMGGTLERFTSGCSPLQPSREGLQGHVASLVSEARALGAHTLILSSEGFSDLGTAELTTFIDMLEQCGVHRTRVVWSSFDPDERLPSYVNQYVRQGEHVRQSDIAAIRVLLETSLTTTKKTLAHLSHNDVADVIELRYSKRPDYMADLISSLTNAGMLEEFTTVGWPSMNRSMNKLDTQLINAFNRLNVRGRSFDPDCPVTFSSHYPRQRERLVSFINLVRRRSHVGRKFARVLALRK